MTDQNAAVEAARASEIERLVRTVEDMFRRGETYATAYRPFAYRIFRTVDPSLTRERWREIAGREPDTSRDLNSPEEHQRQARRRRGQADDALLRQYNRPRCCYDCNYQSADELRRTLGLPEYVDRQEYVSQEDQGQPEVVQERTCTCDACTEERCQGDCEACGDHDCQQCYPDHGPYDCCGYCPECDEHRGENRYEVCDRGHCHECDHNCED